MTPLSLPSPLHRLDNLSARLGIDLWIKRDDLIPQFLGGNKVRKTYLILKSYIESHGLPRVLVTNGGSESNHARVVALMGAQLGCQVHLVLHGQRPAQDSAFGNSFFFGSAGAYTHYVESAAIGDTIDDIVRKVQSRGDSCHVIPGGGHCTEGAQAYYEALDELPFKPDYLVHASGTGGTQAGLLQGIEVKGWHTKIFGISVARSSMRGITEIAKLLPTSFPKEKIILLDEFRFGGYEKFDDSLFDFVRNVIKEEAVPIDLTYTGKAMYGLQNLVESGSIESGAKVVFWHTGGLLNLTSASL